MVVGIEFIILTQETLISSALNNLSNNIKFVEINIAFVKKNSQENDQGAVVCNSLHHSLKLNI